MKRPLVIAHRGSSGERPENTWSAFELAVSQGADMIETDLHLSRDGVIVIHHDASLTRLGDPGEIRDRSALELGRLDAAPGSEEMAAMPTLEELLERFGGRIAFNLELKVGMTRPYPGIEEQVIAAVDHAGLLSAMLFSCFDDGVLARLRAACPEARLAALVAPEAPEGMLRRARAVGAEAINPQCFLVTPEIVAEAHGEGLAVYPYTANELPEMNRLLDCGVDGVISNFPARLKALVDERLRGNAV